jgi:acetylornithine/succinyldiaminopimelate/putrescine aminotransferase
VHVSVAVSPPLGTTPPDPFLCDCSTYGGNPLACAAGLAVAQYLYDNDVLKNVRDRGEQLSQGLEKLAKKYPTILGQVRGWYVYV